MIESALRLCNPLRKLAADVTFIRVAIADASMRIARRTPNSDRVRVSHEFRPKSIVGKKAASALYRSRFVFHAAATDSAIYVAVERLFFCRITRVFWRAA